MDEGLQEVLERRERGEKLTPSELGRVGAYVRTENRRKRAEALVLAGGETEPKRNPQVAHLEKLAEGGGMVAIQAMRDLRAIEATQAKATSERAMLELLTPDQRACIHATLEGRSVSQELALRAWCGESPANEHIP
jgi:hypothetical protein